MCQQTLTEFINIEKQTNYGLAKEMPFLFCSHLFKMSPHAKAKPQKQVTDSRILNYKIQSQREDRLVARQFIAWNKMSAHN